MFRRALCNTQHLRSTFRTTNYKFYSSESGTPQEFTSKWSTFFQEAEDLFEVQRGLNNCFGYDVVPPVQVIEEALRAARRMNDFATAERVLCGIRDKVENKKQYEHYLEYLKPMMEEMGVVPPEELGR